MRGQSGNVALSMRESMKRVGDSEVPVNEMASLSVQQEAPRLVGKSIADIHRVSQNREPSFDNFTWTNHTLTSNKINII